MEVQCFEIKTEADSNDITLCSDDDKPSTGMFTVSDSRGLVATNVTSGALSEPSSQLIHNKCINERKTNRTYTEPNIYQTRTEHKPTLYFWCSGNALVSINAVALHRARLVLGWVTAFGQVNCLIM